MMPRFIVPDDNDTVTVMASGRSYSHVFKPGKVPQWAKEAIAILNAADRRTEDKIGAWTYIHGIGTRHTYYYADGGVGETYSLDVKGPKWK